MAKQNLSAGVTGVDPMRPDSPLHALAPGELAKKTPAQRGRAMKRTTKRPPDMAALMTPSSILGK
jgi:hypothetical protein